MQRIIVATLFSVACAIFASLSACTSSSNLATEAGLVRDAEVDTGISYIQPGETPQDHFATTPTCRTTRPPVTPDAPDAGDAGVDPSQCVFPCCASDGDCTDAGLSHWTNGRCSDIRGKVCTWDQCVTSSDCKGSICSCASDDPSDYNKCVSGNCQNDGDCGPAGFCSPSIIHYCGVDTVSGIYCHTLDDKCLNDSDCASIKNPAGDSAKCGFNEELKRWQCVLPYCAG